HLYEDVDVRQLDEAILIGGRMAWIVLNPVRRPVALDAVDTHEIGASDSVNLRFEADRLTRIGIGPGRSAGGLRVRQILRHHAQALRLHLQSGGGNLERYLQRIDHPAPPASPWRSSAACGGRPSLCPY